MSSLPERVTATRVIVELGDAAAPAMLAACEVLVQERLDVWTLPVGGQSTPASLETYFATRALIGVHGVRDGEGAEWALRHGAAFVLADAALGADALTRLAEGGVPVVATAFSPTEVVARAPEAAAVAIWPANLLDGAQYAKALSRIAPGVDLVARGDLSSHGARTWLRGGALAIAVGEELLGADWPGGDLTGMRRRARAYASLLTAS